jgi:hypothetical protein
MSRRARIRKRERQKRRHLMPKPLPPAPPCTKGLLSTPALMPLLQVLAEQNQA